MSDATAEGPQDLPTGGMLDGPMVQCKACGGWSYLAAYDGYCFGCQVGDPPRSGRDDA